MARQLTPNHASNPPSTGRDCRSYPNVRPSVRTCDLDRAFTNVLRPVVRMHTTQVPHRQASTPRPPHVMFLTRPSPRLAIFIACYVARAGEGLGTRLSPTHTLQSITYTMYITDQGAIYCMYVPITNFYIIE